jgi:hypothetical protein
MRPAKADRNNAPIAPRGRRVSLPCTHEMMSPSWNSPVRTSRRLLTEPVGSLGPAPTRSCRGP